MICVTEAKKLCANPFFDPLCRFFMTLPHVSCSVRSRVPRLQRQQLQAHPMLGLGQQRPLPLPAGATPLQPLLQHLLPLPPAPPPQWSLPQREGVLMRSNGSHCQASMPSMLPRCQPCPGGLLLPFLLRQLLWWRWTCQKGERMSSQVCVVGRLTEAGREGGRGGGVECERSTIGMCLFSLARCLGAVCQNARVSSVLSFMMCVYINMYLLMC